MTNNTQVVHAEWVDNGVVVSFDDGRSVFYSADLLLSVLPQAQLIGIDEVGQGKSTQHPPDEQ